MRKFTFLKIFLIFFLCLTPISCHHINNIETNTIEINDNNQIYGSQMYNAFEREFSVVQFDSICDADHISNNLKTWHVLYFKDGDNGEVVAEYMYIKYSGNTEYIYRLIKVDNDTYKITKRIKK